MTLKQSMRTLRDRARQLKEKRPGYGARLDFYVEAAVREIVTRGARVLGIPIDPGGAAVIASRARGTPRVALRLLRRVRDYAQVRAAGVIDAAVADEALTMLDIDPLGSEAAERQVEFITRLTDAFWTSGLGKEIWRP